MKQNPGPSENTIQADFFKWLAFNERDHPELSLFYAIPNGTNKSIASRVLHKRTGLKSGVPDCHLPVMGTGAGVNILPAMGLWIEFKSKRGTLSDTQKLWIDALRNAGHRVEICRSWPDAANVVIEYLGLDIKAV